MPNFIHPEEVPDMQRPGKLIRWLREAGYGEPIAYEPNPVCRFIKIIYSDTANLIVKPRTVVLNTPADSIEVVDEELFVRLFQEIVIQCSENPTISPEQVTLFDK